VFYLNQITLWQVLSLAVGFFIPILVLELGSEDFIQVLNFYMVSLSVAIIFDSLSLLRVERIFSKRHSAELRRLVGTMLSSYLLYFFVLLIVAIIEISTYGFSFVMVGFGRHVANVARNCLVYWRPLNFFKTFVNQIATLRNILLILSVIYFESSLGFSLSIFAISLFETVSILLIILSKYQGKIVISFSQIIKGLMRQIRSMFRRPQSWVSLSSAVVGIAERSLAVMVFSSMNLTVYLTYKMLPQYIDAAYAAIGYQVRTYSLSKGRSVSLSAILLPIIGISGFGLVFSFIYFSIDSVLSAVIFVTLSLLITLRRSVDIFKVPVLVVYGKYPAIMIRNFFEIFLGCGALLLSVMLFDDVDRIFLMVCVCSIVPSFVLYVHGRYIGVL